MPNEVTVTPSVENVAAGITGVINTQFAVFNAHDVQLEANIRDDQGEMLLVDDAFVATIKEFGVLTPVLGRRGTDGTIYVRAGQRRTLAAREAGVDLPVYFYESDDAVKEPAWFRAAQQLIENDQRRELTAGQRVRAYAQLSFDGLSVTRIAQTLKISKDEAKAALTINKSETVLALADHNDLDLLQLAAITEFEDDAELSEELITVAIENPDHLEHAISSARAEVQAKKLIEARRIELEAEGKKIYSSQQVASGEVSYLYNFSRDNSIEVDPELGDGIGYVLSGGYNEFVRETKVIAEPEKYGYKSHIGGQSHSGPRTDEQKAQMRHVVACNRAWEAAEPVRRDWLAEFVNRNPKSLPRDIGAFIAIAMTRYGYDFNSKSDNLAHDLLGITDKGDGYRGDKLAELVESNPAKAGLVTLALVIGKLELCLNRDSWRTGTKATKFFLMQLRSWGYTLSQVEEVSIGERTALDDNHAPAVDDEELTDADE